MKTGFLFVVIIIIIICNNKMLNKQFGLEIKRVKKKKNFTNIANGLLFLLLKQGESMLLETWCLSMNDRY